MLYSYEVTTYSEALIDEGFHRLAETIRFLLMFDISSKRICFLFALKWKSYVSLNEIKGYNMKKIVSVLLSLLVFMSVLPVSQAFAKENLSTEMQNMINQGVITGYSDGTYKPFVKVKRGEFATFLYRALKLPEGEHVFKDVSKSSGLAVGINAAAKAKIVMGTSYNTFDPNSYITRQQMAMMISRSLDYLKVPEKVGQLNFLDNNQISQKAAVSRMVGHGIISGYKSGNGYIFKPNDPATREHAAAFISRMLAAAKTGGGETTPEETVISDFEKQVAALVNEERAKAGLKPLTLDTNLSKVARLKSEDMYNKKYFSHTSPTYGSPFDMMKKYGITFWAAGENIARGQQTPQQVMNSWMNSEGHRKNILNSNYTHIGVGHFANGNYWTQMFIGK